MSLSFARTCKNALEEFQNRNSSGLRKSTITLQKISPGKKKPYENLKNAIASHGKNRASDINLGGPRTNDKVWYRVYGNLEPSPEVPTYANDEVPAIALSILSDQQKTILFNERNIDFAFAFSTDQSQKPYRFRCDIYY